MYWRAARQAEDEALGNAFAFLPKPVILDELGHVVTLALERRNA
jgi:hypothetical protein